MLNRIHILYTTYMQNISKSVFYTLKSLFPIWNERFHIDGLLSPFSLIFILCRSIQGIDGDEKEKQTF